MLVDVVFFVSNCEDLTLIDAVDSNGFEDLGLDEVAESGLSHDGDGHGLFDFLDELWVTHSSHTALGMSMGTHSRTMTAKARASSVIWPYSALTTSMIREREKEREFFGEYKRNIEAKVVPGGYSGL